MITDGSRVVTLSVDLRQRILGYLSESSLSTRIKVHALKVGVGERAG